MPVLISNIQESEDSIVRPIVMEVARKIMRATGIPADTRIFYPGFAETGQQKGSSIDPKENYDPVIFNHGNRLNIEISENDDVALMSYGTTKAMFPPVFEDSALGFFCRPEILPSQVTINFTYRATDKASAIRWRDMCRIKTAALRQQLLFTINYHYPLGETFMEIAKKIHEMRNNIAPYNDLLNDYIKENSSQGLTQITTLGKTNTSWVVPMRQQRVQGWFEFETGPEEASKEGNLGDATISFSFKFLYDRPDAIYIRYPLFVHQQELPEEFLPNMMMTKRPEEFSRIASASVNPLLSFEDCGQNYNRILQRRGLSYPPADDFIPGFVTLGTVRFYTSFVFVSPDDPRDVLKLDEAAPDWRIDDDVLQFMKDEAPYMNTAGKSVFNVSVYQGQLPLHSKYVEIDGDLNVRLNKDMDLRKPYRLRFGVYYDWSLLDPDAIERAKEHGEAAKKVIDALRPDITLPPVIDGYLPSVDDMINKKIPDNLRRGFWTVQTLTVETYRA